MLLSTQHENTREGDYRRLFLLTRLGSKEGEQENVDDEGGYTFRSCSSIYCADGGGKRETTYLSAACHAAVLIGSAVITAR